MGDELAPYTLFDRSKRQLKKTAGSAGWGVKDYGQVRVANWALRMPVRATSLEDFAVQLPNVKSQTGAILIKKYPAYIVIDGAPLLGFGF
jgi:hypothetical protein